MKQKQLNQRQQRALDYARELLAELDTYEITEPIQIQKHFVLNDLVKFSKATAANINNFEPLNPYWMATAQRLKMVLEYLKNNNAKK